MSHLIVYFRLKKLLTKFLKLVCDVALFPLNAKILSTHMSICSKLLVNVGDKVYQGQNICLVGNTGHSFGSHLHFEVRLNDTPVDPRPILGI